MSFQQKSVWMPRDGSFLSNGEMGYDDSSKSEAKRGHQWFMDAAASELFSNKKQAIESFNSQPVSGIADVSVSPWQNASCFQSVSGPFGDHLFGSESIRTVNLVDRNISSVETGNLNMGRKDFEDQYGSGSSAALSMSHTIEDASSCLSFGGLRKVKVDQVRDSNNDMRTLMGHPYGGGFNSTISMSSVFGKNGNAILLGPTYRSEDESTRPMGPTFSKTDGNFISIGHTFNKRANDFIPVGHNYKGNDSILSMGQPFDKEDGNFISIGQSFEKGDANLISLSPFYGKGQENFISMAPAYSKPNESLISMASSFDKEGDNIIPVGPSYHKADCNITAMAPRQDKGESNILSMHPNYKKGESNTISFGGFHDESRENCSGSIISGYDLLMSNQNSAQASEVPCQQVLVESNPDSNVNGAPQNSSTTDTNPKHKESKTSKKVSPNNFPSNVKSLLSTGMLDGVVVKYVSWSREKSLKGYIQGTGYMCGCKDCNFEKALNAYEFERHANCKTKHPNNHIYFESGKTIYAVVQELKNTPQELLFDAIQTVTGSQINQKNFRIWKASYQAATRELQRIYGKDDAAVSS
ncbi:hypothetical protein ES332_A05G335300v1 [Gossypium tomentosum]|uniref:Tify domain-containing protein n=2 Tax=Gossypium tomentosum TaxID=34277 RepID=A0A5D2QQL5_GOSTO|nr:hypothetical protein ES332_A05G335300v1 [Gossypium tomentosum]